MSEAGTRRQAQPPLVGAPGGWSDEDAAPPAADVVGEGGPSSGALIRRAHDTLAAHGSPMSPEALAHAVFGASAALGAADTWGVMLKGLLSRSPLFATQEQGRAEARLAQRGRTCGSAARGPRLRL